MRITYIIAAVILGSCDTGIRQLETNYYALTGNLYQLEESNRIYFREHFSHCSGEDESVELQCSIVDLFDYLDTYSEKLLNESGGYNNQGELANGLIKASTLSILDIGEIQERLQTKLSTIHALASEKSSNTLGMNQELAEAVSLLTLIDNENADSITVAELYTILIITQNRILVTALRYPHVSSSL